MGRSCWQALAAAEAAATATLSHTTLNINYAQGALMHYILRLLIKIIATCVCVHCSDILILTIDLTLVFIVFCQKI